MKGKPRKGIIGWFAEIPIEVILAIMLIIFILLMIEFFFKIKIVGIFV